MKPRKMTLIFALMVALCSMSAAQHSTARTPAVRSPEIVLKEFYKWYIHAGSHDIDPFKKDKATLRKYVTVRFIREIEREKALTPIISCKRRTRFRLQGQTMKLTG